MFCIVALKPIRYFNTICAAMQVLRKILHIDATLYCFFKNLLCVLYAANFSDDVDFDLSRIFEFVFEFLRDFFCEEHG